MSVKDSFTKLRRVGTIAAAAMATAIAVSGCANNSTPAPEPVEETVTVRIAVPTEKTDAAITELYAQYLDSKPEFEIERVPVDGDPELFFDETEIAETLDMLRQDQLDLAILRSGQVLNTMNPQTGLVPLTTDEVEPTAEPSPWPSTADQKNSELEQALPATIRLGPATSAKRGAQLMLSPVTKGATGISSASDLADDCADLTLSLQEELPAPYVRAELNALLDCIPDTVNVDETAQVLKDAMSGKSDLAIIDSANPQGWDKGLRNVDGAPLLRADTYRPLLSSHQFDDANINALNDSMRSVSDVLNNEELHKLFRYVHEEPTMSPEDAATWWLDRHGLLPEEQ